MATDSVIVTQEEIAKFRTELANYPKPEAITALNVIEECDGDVEDAIPLLLLRETGTEPDRSLDDLLAGSRKFICQEEVREALESGIIGSAIEPISMGAGFPPGTATAICIFAFKLGIKKLCNDSEA